MLNEGAPADKTVLDRLRANPAIEFAGFRWRGVSPDFAETGWFSIGGRQPRRSVTVDYLYSTQIVFATADYDDPSISQLAQC
jgi:hypothetical protein